MSDAKKYDQEKTQLELIPPVAIELLGKVLTYGSRKYDRWNWAKGFAWSRLYGAALRHMNAWYSGEDKDSETNLSHLGHALCCIVFLIAHEAYGLGVDDRWRPEKK